MFTEKISESTSPLSTSAVKTPPFVVPTAALRHLQKATPSWISNGHWAIRRCAVANLPKLEGPSDSDAIVKQLMPTRVEPWSATDRVISDHPYRYRVFVDPAGTRRTAFWIRDLTVLRLNAPTAVLYGTHPDEPFRNARRASEATALLSPCRLDPALLINDPQESLA